MKGKNLQRILMFRRFHCFHKICLQHKRVRNETRNEKLRTNNFLTTVVEWVIEDSYSLYSYISIAYEYHCLPPKLSVRNTIGLL